MLCHMIIVASYAQKLTSSNACVCKELLKELTKLMMTMIQNHNISFVLVVLMFVYLTFECIHGDQK